MIELISNIKMMNDKRKENAKKLLKSITKTKLRNNDNKYVIIRDIKDMNRFAVLASNGGSYYEVFKTNSVGWVCSCYDFVNKGTLYPGMKCKHIQAIEIIKEKRKRIPRGGLKL